MFGVLVIFTMCFLSLCLYTFNYATHRFSPKYVKEYIEGAKPLFCVGEYWDSCNYKGSTLDYNQGTIIEH